MTARQTIAALWASDESGRYPPQFVGAVSEGLRDAWWEESERLRELAEAWFCDFVGAGDDDGPWRFDVAYHHLEAPAPVAR